MANTTELSLPLQGMITDVHRLNGNEKTYCFAMNAITSDFFTGGEFMLGNEPSNVCAVTFPPNYQVVGFIEVPEQKRTIYILTNPTNGNSQIGEVLNCTFEDVTDHIGTVYCADCFGHKVQERTPLQEREEQCHCEYYLIAQVNCLNLSVNYPVDIEYKLTNCGINIYFTDNLNERGFMYLDYENGYTTDHLVVSNQMLIQDFNAAGNCSCPDGYTYDPDDNICIQRIITPVVLSNDLRVACGTSSIAYTNFGVAIYDAGYLINGTGTSTIHHLADTYWSNPAVNTSAGILNRTALWACGAGGIPQAGEQYPLNEYIGFIFPVDVVATKTYYVGIAGDNEVRIRVDCNDVVVMNDSAMAAQYPVAGLSAPFKYWHIYPVTLTAGHHVIELTGINFGLDAGFGAEIYDNTEAEIIAATAGAGLNIIFSTQNMEGQLLHVSSTFSGDCANGTCMDIIDDTLVCVETLTEPAICDGCDPIIITNEIDCEKLKMHPDYDKPCIEFIEFVNGGNLKEGVYQVLFAYSDTYGNPITTYMPASPTAPLFEEQIKFETNNTTNKALKFRIKNLRADTFFGYYNIVIAQTIDNFTEFIYAGTFSTTQNDYVYTGFEQSVKRLAAPEVLFRRPYYPLAKGVTKANNFLFFTGVSEYPELNLQPVANNINLYWQTVAIKEAAYFDPRHTFYFHTYQRDEVYAFGIVFEFANGRETCAFHIPGRTPTEYELEIVDTADVIDDIDCFEEPINKRWQVYNTGSVLGGDYEYNENCEVDKCWEYGLFAYWESTDLYPTNSQIWGELCNKPIRHHKFPDSCVTHIHDSANGSKVFKDNNYVFPIGVRIDHQSVINALDAAVVDGHITAADRDSVTSFRLVRGNRVGHKSIDAKGLLFDMLTYNKFNKDYYFPNYAYNDLSADKFLNGVSRAPQRYTFHSPDTHFVHSGLGNILKIETEEYGKSEGYFTHSDCQARHKFVSGFVHTLAFGLGLAAALSATGEKQCKVITYKTDHTAHTDWDASGKSPYGNVSGKLTEGTGTISTTEAQGSWNGTGDADTTAHSHDLQGVNAQNTDTGANTSTNSGNTTTIGGFSDDLKTGDHAITKPESVTYTTCKGEAYQVFNSDTFIGTLFGIANKVLQRTMLGLFEMDKILETVRSLIPYKNYSIQYNSVGKYNNYICVAEGNKVRKLDKAVYLNPIMQSINEPSTAPDTLFETITVNNWDRESSVYLKTNTVLADPTKDDNSKVSMSILGMDMDDLNSVFGRDIASYYGSVKRYVPNQYGQICNVHYLETSACSFNIDGTYTGCETSVFGGDTFITRFGLKRKMPFFIHTMCGLPDGSDVLYNELGNAGVPKYYFNTPEPIGARINSILSLVNPVTVFGLVTSENDKNYDIHRNRLLYQDGYIHMFNYGIPYFLVESDINTDYRHGQNLKEKDFYPHASDLKKWMEEDYVPIHEDNYYFYNRTYSKQNHESPICTNCIKDLKELTCKGLTGNRIIYSEPMDTENKNDNWLIFKANSYYDFPLTLGNLITADGIENDKVLVRLEKGTQIFSAYNTIQATEENIQVGTGGIFASRPRDIATTDLGYAGTQNRDILHTEYGHIWADAERGQVFNLATGGQGIDEITKEGMRNWFKENLPFQIRKDFKNMPLEDIDNNLNGVGLHYCFDKRFNRILITKLDYKLIDKKVMYDPLTKVYYKIIADQQVGVNLYDPRYFCNKSWTISYNFFQKSWVSYHSYRPNFYVEHIDSFESAYKRIGVNQQKTYLHNATNKSFQVFYGKLEPFTIEFQPKFAVQNNLVNSIEYYLDVIRYHNDFDTHYISNKTFNKAEIYNENQTSGLRRLVVKDPENMQQSISYPIRVADAYEILVTNSEGMWRFNDFWNVARPNTNLPLYNYDCANVNRKLNSKAINYDIPEFDQAAIRGKMCRIRLTNDRESNYKFLFSFAKINQRQSFR